MPLAYKTGACLDHKSQRLMLGLCGILRCKAVMAVCETIGPYSLDCILPCSARLQLPVLAVPRVPELSWLYRKQRRR